VYRDDSEVEKTEGTTYKDQALEPGKTYTFKVSAFNKASNFQTQESNIITFTVPGKQEEEQPELPVETPPATEPTPSPSTEPTESPSAGEEPVDPNGDNGQAQNQSPPPATPTPGDQSVTPPPSNTKSP
jgi:hypothetical protein